MRQIVPIFLLLVAIFGTLFYTKPLYATIAGLQAQNAQYQTALQNAQALNAKITDLNNIKNSFSGTDLDRLQKMVPESVDTVKLAIEMNQIATKYSSGIKGISISNPSSDSGSGQTAGGPAGASVNPIAISFSITAPYDKLIDFLQDLESNLRLTDVTSVTFSPGANDVYTFSIMTNTYWLQ